MAPGAGLAANRTADFGLDTMSRAIPLFASGLLEDFSPPAVVAALEANVLETFPWCYGGVPNGTRDCVV